MNIKDIRVGKPIFIVGGKAFRKEKVHMYGAITYVGTRYFDVTFNSDHRSESVKFVLETGLEKIDKGFFNYTLYDNEKEWMDFIKKSSLVAKINTHFRNKSHTLNKLHMHQLEAMVKILNIEEDL